jgi:outer membrane receptor protein involved in Fe transport
MKGKTGINVMIDGRSVRMSAEELASYLKGMPASSVQKIELITNPSAKYDAAGTGGIIDIKTKKGRKDGFNASVYSSYSQGRYEKMAAGASFNFKKKRFNWFGNYDFGKKRDFYDLQLDRTFYSNDSATARYVQHNYVVFPFFTHIAKLGCDVNIGRQAMLGFVLNGNRTHFTSDGYSYSQAMDGHDQLQYNYNTNSTSKEARDNASANINFRKVLDTLGSEIGLDVDAAVYSGPIKQNFTSNYIDPLGNSFQPESYVRTDVQAQLNIYSGKIDFSHAFSHTFKMESGIKSSYVTADNNKEFYNTFNGVETLDTGKTNHFLYSENINAGYLTLSKDINKINLVLGLRAEQTAVRGNQATSNIVFTRNYAQLFPNASALYSINKDNEVSVGYSRRINRPDYQSLNPFIVYVDPTFYKAGNPYLQPELSDNIEMSYNYKQKISISPYYSYAVSTIGAVLLQDDINKITIQTEENMSNVSYYGISVNLTLKPAKWWNSFTTIDWYNGHYVGTQQGQDYARGNDVYSINTTNSFMLPKNFSAEISYFYKTRELFSVLNMDPSSSLNVGLKKTLAKNWSFKLGMNDILGTNNTSGGVQFNTINESFARHRDTRTVAFSITCTIGKGGASSAARRKSSAEEEKKRAGASGA